MDKILAGAVAGVASKAGDGIQVLDINDEIMNLETDKWVQYVIELLDATCNYINNGASTSCSGIDTQYGNDEPEHPKEILQKESNQLLKRFIGENANPDKLLSMLTKYEKIAPKSASHETGSDGSDKPTESSTQNGACVCEKPIKNDSDDVNKDKPITTDNTEVAVATTVGDNNKSADLMSGGANGLGGTNSVADMLKPGSSISTDPKKIVKTIVDKQVKYALCNKFVHDRIRDLLKSIYRNSLKELNKDADEHMESIFKEHIEFFRKKINDERINTREDKLKLFAPLLSLEDEKYKLLAMKGYITTLAEMYEYLQYREEYENGQSVKEIIYTHKDKINDNELLMKVLKDLPKKYDEFVKLMGGEVDEEVNIMDVPGEGNIFQNIMSMGGKKKRKPRFTKKRRKPKHNRTK